MLKGRSYGVFTISMLMALVLAGCNKSTSPNENTPESEVVVVVLNNLSETYSYYMPETNDTIFDVDTTGSAPNDLLIDGNYAYIVNSGFGGVPTLMKIDLGRDSLIATYTFPSGSNPFGITKDENFIYVTCSKTDMLYRFDPYLRPIDSVKVGKAPEWLATKDGKVFVACTGYDFSDYTFGEGALFVVADGPQGLFVEDSVYAGINAQDVDIIGDSLYVLATGNYADVQGKIYIYTMQDTSLMLEDSINVGNSPGYMYAHNGVLYLADWSAGLAQVIPCSGKVIWIPVGEGASRILIDYNNQGYVTRFDATGNNYLLLFDPDRLVVTDSIFMGTAKGVQGLGLWLRIH